MANGKGRIDMGMELQYGKTVQNIRVIGSIIRHMGKGSFAMLMEISMRATGKRIRHMVTVFIRIKMVPHTKVNGPTISKMDLEKKCGPTAPLSRDNMSTARKMVKATTSGPMVPNTKEIG